MAQVIGKFALELRVVLRAEILLLQLLERVHECLRHEPSAVRAETAMRIRNRGGGRCIHQDRRLEEARLAVDAQCEKLAAGGARRLAQLSETELLARLALDQPTQTVRARLFLMISLLEEAGEIAAAEGRMAEAREICLKALDLLLEVSAEEASEFPAYVPSVEKVVRALAGAPLPVRTQAFLMRHYESTGQLAKAEDALYSILDANPGDKESLEFGAAFYERILRQNDAMLTAGHLPRAEAEEGLKELKSRHS
jgi:tetratricopeptide (TPR) repeat protein